LSILISSSSFFCPNCLVFIEILCQIRCESSDLSFK